jgi:hypothetical protein
MPTKIKTYAELQQMIRKALREQNHEWIDAHGKSAICDAYEARFAELLVLFGAISRTAPRRIGWSEAASYGRSRALQAC